MVSLLLFGSLLALLSLNVPIAFAIGLAGTVVVMTLERVNLEIIAQRMFYGVDSFVLVAVPLFMLLGEVLQEARITERLLAFVQSLVGHVRGGLGYVTVLAEMVLSGITGSGSADAAATATVMIPAMTRAGYRPDFSAALVGSAAVLGPIIPPSVGMVVYGSLAQVSVGRLFIGGVVPGILVGGYLMVVIAMIARRAGLPRGARPTLATILRNTGPALLIVLAPVIIIGGILTGIFTPTESAAVGCVYALILGVGVYRTLSLRALWASLERSFLASAKVMFIVATAYIFSWILAREGVAAKVATLPVFSDTSRPWMILVALNIALLILGCLMEFIAILIIVTPIMLPICTAAGIDPVHLGVVMVVNLSIGLITPPVGLVMYIVCSISRTSIPDFTRRVWPFLAALIFTLLLITYIPALVTALPNALMRD